ncbi:MAG: UV DNA damage repair endonuclease UvsE, partial [Francisellaceae bacterium]|nr:UV DNA damage repair endonuclease UvsE [Francisellaceae bacterium]
MTSSIPRDIQLGLCCLNTHLREQKPTVFCSRTMIQKTIKEKGIDELKRRVLLNLDDLLKVIQWNEDNGIRVYRLSSEMFPHKTNKNVEQYTLDFAAEKLKAAGDLAKKYGHRLTFHPGQFNVLGTPEESKLQQTINGLTYHANVLDLMGCGVDSVMVIHGGGLYGDKEKAKARWSENYLKLPKIITDRLVLENCERCFSIQDCLDISEKVHVPVVFDTHHFDCYNQLHPEETHLVAEEYIPHILTSWERRGIKPKFHVSEQGSGRVGHHSDY